MKFRGGYIFKHFEGAAQPILRELSVPSKVFFPLPENISGPFFHAVKTGDSVHAGDPIITSGNDTGIVLVSSVNGIVTQVDDDGIVIQSDGTLSFKPVQGHTREPWHLDRSDVFALLLSTGCSFMFGNRFTSLSSCDSVKHLIINAVHNSPLNQSWAPEIIGNREVFTDGLRVLKVLFPKAETVIGINGSTKKYFDSHDVKNLAKITVMSNRYPQENPELLSRDAAQVRLVSPEGTYNESVLVIDFSDVIQIAEVFTQGRPFIDRILMVAGPGVSNPGWYRIRLGTPFEEVKTRLLKGDHIGPWRIIRGNPLSGKALDSLQTPVLYSDSEISVISEHIVRELFRFMMPGFAGDSYSKTTVADIMPFIPKKLDAGVHGGVRPCVQCNFCDEVCPVDIYPFLIWKHVGVEAVEECFRLRPFDCVECGLCDYVCPSKIDIMQSVKRAKEEYRKMRRDDAVSH